MSAEQFLEQVERMGLLDDAVVAQMRKQITSSSFRVTAEAVAEMLVKNGYLTRFQASKLLTQADTGAKQESPKQRKRPEKPAAAPDTVVEGVPAPKRPQSGGDDIGLAPLDGEEDTPPASTPVQEDAQEEQDEVVMLEDASEGAPADPGLAPLDEPKPKSTKPQATPGLEPISGVSGLEPVGGTPGLEPVGGTPGLEPIAGTPGLEPVAPAGGLEPLDRAAGLEPIGGGGLEPLDATAGLEPMGGTPGLTPTGQAGLQPPKRRIKKNVWDSKLLLVGGGALILLLLMVWVIWVIVNRDTAAEMLAAADEDYRSEAYAQAINKYEKYLKRFPEDPNVSMARVRIGTAQLWQQVGNPRDKQPALEAAGTILPQIQDEAAFGDARAELASILPDIAEGFSSQAKAQAEIEKAQELVDLAKKAMEFVDNPSYIPTSQRKTIENRLRAIDEDIQLAERNINRTKRLDEAVAAIRAAANAGNTVEAYQKRRDLLGEYPELGQDPKLLEAVKVITERERALVKAVEEPIESSTEDHPAPSNYQVALASRKGEGAAGSDKQVMFFLARGAVYGLQATTGKVLWRRFVGHETLTAPQPLSGQIGAHVIAVDSRRNELLRLNDQSGELVWRLPIGEPFSDPVIHGKNVLLATKSGHVISVDSESGQTLKHIAIPQELRVSPGTSKLRHLYQPGDHSNLYVLDEESLECKDVYYLGHKPGTIETPPVMALGHLFVAVNSGMDYCDLNILAVDENGLSPEPAQEYRVKGHVTVTPIVTGGRVVVVTDLGAIHVLEVNTANPEKPVQPAVDELIGSFMTPLTGYPVLDGGRLFVGNDQFTKYEIQASRNKLLGHWIKNKRDIFVGPPQVIGDTVFHLRRRADSPAYTAAAVHADDGKVLWEVDLATPASLLTVDLQKKMIHSISAGAELFEVTTDDFQVGILDQPAAAAIGAVRTVAFSEAIPMAGVRWAFTSALDRKKMVVYDPKSVSATGRLQARAIKAAGDANATAPPVYFDGGLLLPLDNGQVVLVDPETGDSQILPFQARVEGGTKVQWHRPAVIGSNGKEFVIADNRQKLYRVGIKAQGQPHLAELAQAALEVEIVSALAAAGDTVYGVVRGSGGDSVVSFAAADLSVGSEWALEGRIVWGPEPMGDVVLMASDQEGVLCFETGQKQRWKSPLAYGALAGRPLKQDDDFILTSVGGVVWRVSGADGTELQKMELGEPLGGGAVPFGSRLLLSGSDGTLHVVPALSGS